jgi:hypothetical protein
MGVFVAPKNWLSKTWKWFKNFERGFENEVEDYDEDDNV